jgi:hypothetical protein
LRGFLTRHLTIAADGVDLFGPVQVDMFALVSPPSALISSAGGQIPMQRQQMPDWSEIQGYANPPECDRSYVSKVQPQQAQIVLVTQVSETQPWYSRLLQTLIAVLYLIIHDQKC